MLKQQLLVKKQIKTIECYEPMHEHNSYFNLKMFEIALNTQIIRKKVNSFPILLNLTNHFRMKKTT